MAIRIELADGHVHTILHADRPGVRRQCGALSTDAEIYWADDRADPKTRCQYP